MNAYTIIKNVRLYSGNLLLLLASSLFLAFSVIQLLNDVSALRTGDVRIAIVKQAQRVREGHGRYSHTVIKVEVEYEDEQGTVQATFSQRPPLLQNYDNGFRAGNKIPIVISSTGAVFAYASRRGIITEDAMNVVLAAVVWIFFAYLFWSIDSKSSSKTPQSVRDFVSEIAHFVSIISIVFAVAFLIFRREMFLFIFSTAALSAMLCEAITDGEIYFRSGSVRRDEEPALFWFGVGIYVFFIILALIFTIFCIS